MKARLKITFIATIAFYFFIMMHRFNYFEHGDDYILQALFYMAFSFSVVGLEEAIRRQKNKLKNILLIDFSVRVIVLVLHFIFLFVHINMLLANIIAGVLFAVNFSIQLFVMKKSKNDIANRKIEEVTSAEIKKFIQNTYDGKIDFLGFNFKNKLQKVTSYLELSGKGNIVIIILLAGIFITQLINKHIPSFILISVLLTVIVLYFFIKIHFELGKRAFPDAFKTNISVFFNFLLGYLLLFVSEAFWYEKLGIMRITMWFISILMFCPLFIMKFKVREQLIVLYREYQQHKINHPKR